MVRAAFECTHCKTRIFFEDIDQTQFKYIMSLDYECSWCGLNTTLTPYGGIPVSKCTCGARRMHSIFWHNLRNNLAKRGLL